MIEGRLNIIYIVWKEDCTSSEKKKITACLEECSILCRGTVSWTKSYFVWKENCSLWMKLPFFKHGKERCNLKQIASFKKCCAFWPEYVLIFFESNSVPTLFLQKVPNKYYLFDINKKLKMVDLWGGSYMVPPPKDLPCLTYLFEILWFGMIHVCNPFKSLQPYDTHCQLSKTSVFFWGG